MEIGNSPRPALSLSKGFTFIEVLFAVILLGIGFIMIAAVFPVAIQQTAAVSDETQATALARDAIIKIQAIADSVGANTLFPATGTPNANSVIVPFGNSTTLSTPNLFTTIGAPSSNLILSALGSDVYYAADGRYGWMGFYLRYPGSPFAQVYIVVLQNPNFPNYIAYNASVPLSPPTMVPPPLPPDVYGQPVGSGQPQSASFFQDPSGAWYVTCGAAPSAATGAFLMPCAGPGGAAFPPQFLGRFFRIGAPVPASIAPNSFYLQPGWDITPADFAQLKAAGAGMAATPQTNNIADVYIFGAAPTLNRSPANSSDYTGPYSGPNQDVGVATAFIRINTANN